MNREMLRLAIPNIISNVSVPLLSSVDTALMGRVSELHIGAVGLGAMLFNFLYWNFGFLRMGSTGLTAQAFGAGDKTRTANVLGRAALVALALAAILLLFQQPIAKAGYYLLSVDDTQVDLVAEYFNIRIWAAPASLLLYALLGWFFGVQNAVYPLVLTVFINVVNMAVSYWLVHVQGYGVAGVAYGTLVAQYAGVMLGVGLWAYRYGGQYFGRLRWKALLYRKALSSFLQLNSNIFLRTVCLTVAFGMFYSFSSKEGALILAVNTVLLQFVNWMSYGIDGFAYASESLVGKYAGRADVGRTKQAVRLSFGWGGALAILFAAMYALFPDALLRLFTDQSDVLAAAQPYLPWLIVFPILGFASYIWDGIYIGLTAARAMRDSMLLAFGVFLVVFFITRAYGNHGLWAAMTVFVAARGLVQWAMWHWRDRISHFPTRWMRGAASSA